MTLKRQFEKMAAYIGSSIQHPFTDTANQRQMHANSLDVPPRPKRRNMAENEVVAVRRQAIA